MANLRRRSARLSKTNTNASPARKTPLPQPQLGSVVERDDTPDTVQQSLDEVLATPTTSRTINERFSQLRGLRTPQTEPKLEQAEMNPKTVHRSTTKAPDSGLKLGFSDIVKDKKHDTPSKSANRQSNTVASPFEFRFSADSNLSRDAQKLMDNVREDAARIKAQMLAEKAAQEQKDREASQMFGAGRKIAMPKGKAGRFSDVHMAQFKKMDSIENHASAFRARPGFAAPTVQSLKRSPSKAGLDEADRPRTAGKTLVTQARRVPPPVIGRALSVSPFKSIPASDSSRATSGLTKRARQTEHQDVSDVRPVSALPRLKNSNLYSPTKSSMARSSQGVPSQDKPSTLQRSNSTRSMVTSQASIHDPPAAMDIAAAPVSKPLPPLPTEQDQDLYPNLPSSPLKNLSSASKESRFTSKLPTLAGLKSILRGNRKTESGIERPGTPKRPNTAVLDSSPARKVDFTPSVKSRHAVKLAADSPSPAKIRRETPYKSSEPVFPYDSSAYIIEDDGNQEWEDEDSEITYPSLPPVEDSASVEQSFSTKAKEVNRRESKEFKSIFTTLHPSRSENPATLTSVNTLVNKTNPETHANKVMRSPNNSRAKPSPSTIRQIKGSGVTELVQPFEDKIKTVPHGLPGKKRRNEAGHADEKYGTDEDAKENRLISDMPSVPGGWNTAEADSTEDEDNNRAGKRVRTSVKDTKPVVDKSTFKKPSAARETAAKNARDRKSRGALSLSRLNMLSRPKTRG